jgi:hypothetical protein
MLTYVQVRYNPNLKYPEFQRFIKISTQVKRMYEFDIVCNPSLCM